MNGVVTKARPPEREDARHLPHHGRRIGAVLQHLGAEDDVEALVAERQVVGPRHDVDALRVMRRVRHVDARAICEVALVQRRVRLRPGAEVEEAAVRPPSRASSRNATIASRMIWLLTRLG